MRIGKTEMSLTPLVLVREGETSLAFGLWENGDVDTDGTLTLKAQLVDAEGHPTHTEHTEVTLNLDATDETIAPPTTERSIVGDLAPIDCGPEPGLQYGYDALGNVIVNPDNSAPDRVDTLYDSAGNDLMQSGGGNDLINATRGGNDRIEAGNGDDWVSAGNGDDQVLGGAGSDLLGGADGQDLVEGGADSDGLFGEAGNDELFADGKQERQAALDANDASAGTSSVRGDLADGGAGADFVVGGADADVIMGGADEDLLLGGAGNDNLWGDGTTPFAYRDWSVARRIEERHGVTYYQSEFTRAGIETTAGGDDLIFGGAGDDWLFGDGGDDFIDGGADNDVIFGQQGDDQLLGSAGHDVLSGDELDDPEEPDSGLNGALHGNDDLDGGDGDDTVVGNGGDDVLIGGAGHDVLNGDDGKTPDQYHGKDYVDGGEGDAPRYGDEGDDALTGSGGGNTYLYNVGDGTDTLTDTSKANGFTAENTLRFGSGITSADITLGLGSLLIRVGNDPANVIHIGGFVPGDAYEQLFEARSRMNAFESPVKWRSTGWQAQKTMFTRFCKPIPPRTFIHAESTGYSHDISPRPWFAANQSELEIAA